MSISSKPKNRKQRTRAGAVVHTGADPAVFRGPAIFQSRLPYFANDRWEVRFVWGLIELFTMAVVLCFLASVAAPSVGTFGRMLVAVIR